MRESASYHRDRGALALCCSNGENTCSFVEGTCCDFSRFVLESMGADLFEKLNLESFNNYTEQNNKVINIIQLQSNTTTSEQNLSWIVQPFYGHFTHSQALIGRFLYLLFISIALCYTWQERFFSLTGTIKSELLHWDYFSFKMYVYS